MKKQKLKFSKTFKSIVFFIIIFNFDNCASTIINNKPIDIKLAIIGNTNPDSPFTGFTEELSNVIKNINEDNPIAVFHTGNNIHGGMDWMGIKQEDIERQYKQFNKIIKWIFP